MNHSFESSKIFLIILDFYIKRDRVVVRFFKFCRLIFEEYFFSYPKKRMAFAGEEKPPTDHTFAIFSSFPCAKSHVKKYQDGIAEGYEIVCMDGSFHVHEYCLFNSEFLYNMLQGSDTVVINISL